jgi:hypothetical protein
MANVFINILKTELQELSTGEQNKVITFLNKVSDSCKRIYKKFSSILVELSVDAEHSATNADEKLRIAQKFTSDWIVQLVDYTVMFQKMSGASNKLALQFCVQMMWEFYHIQMLTNVFPISFDELIQEWNAASPPVKFNSNMTLSLTSIVDSCKSSDMLVLVIEKEWNSYIIL